MKSLIILGAGGHGKVVAETAIAIGCFKEIVFLDDRYSKNKSNSNIFNDFKVIGNLSFLIENDLSPNYSDVVVALGENVLRSSWLKKLINTNYKLTPLIHPNAWVSPTARINPGTVVFANVAIQANARIGFGAILNTGCNIDHDVVLEDGVHICPGVSLAGGVYVGERSMIGIGASVIQNINIGSDVNIGAGSTVVKNLPDRITAIGSPAKILSKN